MQVAIKHLAGKLPHQADLGSFGWDCYSRELVDVPRFGRIKVALGFALELPATVAAMLLPRSGLALKQGLTLANSPGLIDASYRGEVCAIVLNLGSETIQLEPGDRVCQMLFVSSPQVELVPVLSLSDTERGAGGFGSTGR